MTTDELAELSLGEQAHWWVEELNHSGIERNAAFLKWLQESPAHVREFLLAYVFEEALLKPAIRAWRLARNSRGKRPPTTSM